MPRRESARRNHPLARECDIIETLHMRLTLLQMTFGKHIERKHICFFPGEVMLTMTITHFIHSWIFLLSDFGRSLSHPELRRLDQPPRSGVQGDGRAVRPEHNGDGVLQREHRAFFTWDYIFRKRLSRVHAAVRHALQAPLHRDRVWLPDVQPSQRRGLFMLGAAPALQYS